MLYHNSAEVLRDCPEDGASQAASKRITIRNVFLTKRIVQQYCQLAFHNVLTRTRISDTTSYSLDIFLSISSSSHATRPAHLTLVISRIRLVQKWEVIYYIVLIIYFLCLTMQVEWQLRSGKWRRRKVSWHRLRHYPILWAERLRETVKASGTVNS